MYRLSAVDSEFSFFYTSEVKHSGTPGSPGAPLPPQNGAPQTNQAPGQPTFETERERALREIGEEELRWKTTLLTMLAEDARNGNLRDPEGRDPKGRPDKVVKASKVGRRKPLEEMGPGGRPSSEMSGLNTATFMPNDQISAKDSSSAIDAASSALDTLKSVAADMNPGSDDPDRHFKIVNLASLV